MIHPDGSYEHEHFFAEEQEPNGRLILSPCLSCGLTALDALEGVKRERDALQERVDELGTERTSTVAKDGTEKKFERAVGPWTEVAS